MRRSVACRAIATVGRGVWSVFNPAVPWENVRIRHTPVGHAVGVNLMQLALGAAVIRGVVELGRWAF